MDTEVWYTIMHAVQLTGQILWRVHILRIGYYDSTENRSVHARPLLSKNFDD